MEGVIKYKLSWLQTKSISKRSIQNVELYRKIAYEKGYIGVEKDGLGYGNISFRTVNDSFIISGSATGHKSVLDINDYAEVVDFDIKDNYIKCIGATAASSESLSHAAIYSSNAKIKVVLHLHSAFLWKKYLNVLPSTDISSEYGTPAMAFSISNIIKKQNLTEGVIIMQGHRNGVVAFAENFDNLFIQLHQYLSGKYKG